MTNAPIWMRATARVDLMRGDIRAARRWSQRIDVPMDAAHRFENLTLARVLIASGDVESRQRALDRLESISDEGHRVEILMLRALAQRNQPDAALPLLDEALRLSEPEGYLRLFADDARMIVPLLHLLLAKPGFGASPSTINAILEAASPLDFGEDGPPGSQLTERELDALRLLASDASTEEIAAAMSVSVSTVRTYAKRIYSKLGVHSRAEAVYLARERKLI